MNNYNRSSKEMSTLVNTLTYFSEAIRNSEQSIGILKDKIKNIDPTSENSSAKLEGLENQLQMYNTELDANKQGLAKASQAAKTLSGNMKEVERTITIMTKLQAAFKELQNSLSSVTNEWLTAGETGLKGYTDQVSKLLGGSHPEAAVAVSVEDERLASKYGMSLINGVSDQYAVQKVKLMDSYNKHMSSGQGKEAAHALQLLNDVDLQKKRDVFNTEQKQEDQLTIASLDPFVTLYKKLGELQLTGNLSPDQYAEIESIRDVFKEGLSTALTEKITFAEKIKELETYKERNNLVEGSAAAENIDKKIENLRVTAAKSKALGGGGIDQLLMYRGATPEMTSVYKNVIEKFSSKLEDKDMFSSPLKNYVNTPLNTIIGILRGVAQKFDTDTLAKFDIEDPLSGYKPTVSVMNPGDYLSSAVDRYSSFNKAFYDEGGGSLSNYAGSYSKIEDPSVGSYNTLFSGELPSYQVSDKESGDVKTDTSSTVVNKEFNKFKDDEPLVNKAFNAFIDLMKSSKEFLQGNKFNAGGAFGDHPASLGGHVSGPGGPREDKVAAYLSPGEFVIRAHTAQQIGYANLDYMNKKGSLPTATAADGGMIPTFAGGGFVNSIANGKGFRTVSGGMHSLIDDLEAGRLSSIKEEGLSLKGVGKQAAFATGELLSRLVKVPLDVFSGIEGASGYLANKGLSGALKDIDKVKDSVFNKVASEGLISTISDVGSSLYGSVTDSLSKGGLGITTDVIGALAGGTGVMSKFNKLTDVGTYIKAAKVASGDGKVSKVRDMLSVLTNESGAIDNPAMVVKDLVSKSKPKVERKFPSLYDRFSPMKKDPTRKAGYNRDMLAIDKFNREYTDKYGVDFGFSRENFLPRQFLPDMGKTIDSYMERYPELKDHLSFVGSTEFTQNMPVDDVLRLAAEVGDPLHNRGRHTVIPTRQGPAGVVQISNENAIKKHFVKAKKDNIPLQSVAGDVKDDLLYTLGHELSHGINRASKNKIQMAEINAALDKLPGDVFESTYISSKKVGDPARAKERFADFGAKFEKIMTDPNRKDNPTMFDMSPEDAVAEVYGYDTRLTSWGDGMVSNLFPDMKFANGGVVPKFGVGGYLTEEEIGAQREAAGEALRGVYHQSYKREHPNEIFADDVGQSNTSISSGSVPNEIKQSKSWLEQFEEYSEKFKKESWGGKAAEEVDPNKVRSFTNVGPGGDILSEIIETTGNGYELSREYNLPSSKLINKQSNTSIFSELVPDAYFSDTDISNLKSFIEKNRSSNPIFSELVPDAYFSDTDISNLKSFIEKNRSSNVDDKTHIDNIDYLRRKKDDVKKATYPSSGSSLIPSGSMFIQPPETSLVPHKGFIPGETKYNPFNIHSNLDLEGFGKIASGYKPYSPTSDEFIESLETGIKSAEGKRLGRDDLGFRQKASLWKTEVGMKSLLGAAHTFKSAEEFLRAAASGQGVADVVYKAKSAGSIAKGLYDLGFSGISSHMYKAFTEDLSKGGTGIASFGLSSLFGGSVMKGGKGVINRFF